MIGDVKKRKASDGTDELLIMKHAKIVERFPKMAEKISQLDKLIQMEDSTDENQSTHDDSEESKDSKERSDSTNATSEEAGAGWYAEFCSFKQQKKEKFIEQAEAINGLKHSDKNQQDLIDVFSDRTVDALYTLNTKMNCLSKLTTEQERHGKLLDEIPAIKSQLETIHSQAQETQAHLSKLTTEQERHGKMLDEIPAIKSQLETIHSQAQETQAHLSKLTTEQERHGKMLDEIPAIKSQLEKTQHGSQVSQETQARPGIWLQLQPSQIDMLTTQLEEKQNS